MVSLASATLTFPLNQSGANVPVSYFLTDSQTAGYPFLVTGSATDIFRSYDGVSTGVTYNSSGATFNSTNTIIINNVPSTSICFDYTGGVDNQTLFNSGNFTLFNRDDGVDLYTSIGASSTLDNSIRAYWRFDETSGTNAVDSVAGLYNLTLTTATFTSNGFINYGYQGASGGRAIVTTPNLLFNQSGAKFMVSVWARPTNLASGFQGIFSTERNSNSLGISLRSDNGNSNIYFRISDGATSDITAYNFNNNQWYHFVVGNNGTHSLFYVDNVLVNSTAKTIGNHLASANFAVGSYRADDFTNTWSGRIDEVGVWNRTLTSSEISELYNGGVGKQYPYDSSIFLLKNSFTFTGKQYCLLSDRLVTQTSNFTYTNITLPTAVSNITLGNGFTGTIRNVFIYNKSITNTDISNGTFVSNVLSQNNQASYFTNSAYLTNYSVNGLSSFTLSIWVNASTQSSTSTIFGTYSTSNKRLHLDVLPNGTPILYSGYTSGNTNSMPSLNITNGGWYNVIYTSNTTHYVWYVNGVLNKAGTHTTGTIAVDNFPLGVGALYYPTSTPNVQNQFTGTLSKLDIITSMYNSSQAFSLFESGIGVITQSFNDTFYNGSLYYTNKTTIGTNLTNQYPISMSSCGVYLNGSLNSFSCSSTSTLMNLIYGFNNVTFIYNYASGFIRSMYYPFLVDNIYPHISLTYPNPNNTTIASTNFNFTAILEDEYLYYAVLNVTNPLNQIVTNVEYNLSGLTQYNLSQASNNSLIGNYTGFILLADGHTAKAIPNYRTEIKGNKIEIGKVKITPSDTKVSNAKITKKIDRYEFSYTRPKIAGKVKQYEDFIVEGGDSIDILDNSEYKGHLIVRDGDNPYNWRWVDFENDQNAPVEIIRINKNQVKARVHTTAESIKFNSVGALNIRELSFTYYYADPTPSVSTTYTTNVLENTYSTFTINLTTHIFFVQNVSNIRLNYSGVISNATFIFATTTGLYKSWFYNLDVLAPDISANNQSVPFNWLYTALTSDNLTLNYSSSSLNQIVWEPRLDVCSGATIYTIGTFWFRDLLTKNLLDTTFYFSLNSFDGTRYYPTISSGTANTTTLCTNLPSSLFSNEWELLGTMSLSAIGINETYIPKIYTFVGGSNNIMSVANPLNLNLTLSPTLNTTTIKYSWLTRDFQNVEGVMSIYECVGNTPTTLVESVSVVEGTAYANLQLLEKPYYYEIIVNDVKYTNADSYSQCRLVEDTFYRFFVDTLPPKDLSSGLGLQFITCSLTNSSDNIVSMVWGTNQYSSSVITGCMNVYRDSIFSSEILYQYCTNTSNTLVRQVPNDNNYYYILGTLYQDGNSFTCAGKLEFNVNKNSLDNFGLASLFALAIMFLGLVLLFAGKPTDQLAGGIIGIVGALWLGITAFSWATASAIVLYLVLGIIITRYGRK
jgi:hypothetical protein